jgi:hypothetical protein
LSIKEFGNIIVLIKMLCLRLIVIFFTWYGLYYRKYAGRRSKMHGTHAPEYGSAVWQSDSEIRNFVDTSHTYAMMVGMKDSRAGYNVRLKWFVR